MKNIYPQNLFSLSQLVRPFAHVRISAYLGDIHFLITNTTFYIISAIEFLNMFPHWTKFIFLKLFSLLILFYFFLFCVSIVYSTNQKIFKERRVNNLWE